MNFKITHILTPIDFSEASITALDEAIFMAKLFEAKLSFVHVKERLSYTDNLGGIELVEEKVDTLVQIKLSSLANSIHANHGIPKPETIIKYGNIADSIVRTAEDKGADIIVMGTHGISGLAEFFMGSNAYKVVTQSTVPVLTIQNHGSRKGFGKIVLPVDNSIPSRQKVKHAAELAKHYGAVVYVAGLITEDEPEVHKKIEVMLKQVNDYLCKHDIPFENKIIVGSNVAKMTMNYAKEINADLIMIMTEQEESVTGLLIGPYAQQVVNHSTIPVMSITPQETYHTEMVHPY